MYIVYCILYTESHTAPIRLNVRFTLNPPSLPSTMFKSIRRTCPTKSYISPSSSSSLPTSWLSKLPWLYFVKQVRYPCLSSQRFHSLRKMLLPTNIMMVMWMVIMMMMVPKVLCWTYFSSFKIDPSIFNVFASPIPLLISYYYFFLCHLYCFFLKCHPIFDLFFIKVFFIEHVLAVIKSCPGTKRQQFFLLYCRIRSKTFLIETIFSTQVSTLNT